MSLVIVKLINISLMNLIAILIIKRITKSHIKLLTLKNVAWFFLSILPTIVFYTTEYDFTTFLTFLLLSLAVKKIFEIDIIASLIYVLFIMIISTIPDLICSAIMINFIEFTAMRNNYLIMFLTNTVISLATYFIFRIPPVIKLVTNGTKRMARPKNRTLIIYCLFAFIAICICYYATSNLFAPTKYYFTINIVIVVFILLILIYMREIIRYDRLLIQNNILTECMRNVEDYQEKQDLKIHEYKNQLSKIIDATKDEKIIKILSDILKVDLTADTYILGQIKYIPKGEIKSLIYYKLLVANKEGLNISVDISPKLKEKDFKLSQSTSRELSQLIGIYFDNAIEAATNSEKKQISLEVYKIKENVFFVITNSYKGKINLKNVIKKGFSTKGTNRGKGLYFADKIIRKSQSFTTEIKTIDNYFIQKLELKKE